MSKLTTLHIKNATPKTTAYKLFDGNGLYLEVTPKGAKYWRAKYYFSGKEKRLSLGVYPNVALQEARKEHNNLKRLLRLGVDPSAQRKAKKTQRRLGVNSDYFEYITKEWFIRKIADKSLSYQKRTQILLDKYICYSLKNIPIRNINEFVVLAMLKKIEEKGNIETVKKIRQILHQILNYAVETGRIEENPIIGIATKLQTAKPKHSPAPLDPQETGKLMAAIDCYRGTATIVAALKLMPLLFVRPSELWSMQWQEIDWSNHRWLLPAEKANTSVTHIIPLSTQAIEILQQLESTARRSKYVFPNARNSNRPISNNAVRTALKNVGYDNHAIVPHGFRTMAKTLLEKELGYSTNYIKQQLANKSASRHRYIQTRYLAERIEMMQSWANYLDKLKVEANTESCL